jgi:hypothetical protein
MATRVPVIYQNAGETGPLPGVFVDVPASSGDLDQSAAVFVSKAGSDASDGLGPNEPVLTIARAITVASGLLTGGAPAVLITVMDGGTYAESLTVPNNVHLNAPGITLIGTVSLGNSASVTLHRHYPSAGGQTLVAKSGGAGHGFYNARILDMRGATGALTGGQGLQNTSNGSVLFAFVGVLYVAANGIGVGDGGAGFGHIHFWTPDLYLAGNSAIGINAQTPNSDFIGYIDHILEFGTPNGCTGVRLQNGIVKLTASEVIAEAAYNVIGGSLHISCPKLTGTRTGTPVAELTNQALRGAWGLLDALNPA